MPDVPTFDPRNHDLRAKLASIVATFDEPFDPDLAQLGLKAILGIYPPMWRQGNFRMLEPVVADGIEAAKRMNVSDAEATLTVRLAALKEALGEWAQVEQLANGMRIPLGDGHLAMELGIHAGTAAHNLGGYRKALGIFEKALGLPLSQVDRDRILHKRHRTLKALGRNREALATVDAIIFSVGESNPTFLAELLLDKADLVRRSDPDQALALAGRAATAYGKAEHERGLAYAQLELGRTYLRLGKREPATTNFALARRLFDDSRYLPGQAHVRVGQGQLLAASGQHLRAAELFAEAADCARQVAYQAVFLRACAYEVAALVRAGRIWRALIPARRMVKPVLNALQQRL